MPLSTSQWLGYGDGRSHAHDVTVINQLSYFANIVLSSFYFDINKDRLYADREDGLERRRVLTVLDQVCSAYTSTRAVLTNSICILVLGCDNYDASPCASIASPR